MCISIPERARYEREMSANKSKDMPYFGAGSVDGGDKSGGKQQYNVIMMKHEFDLDYLLLSLEEDATTTD